MRHLLRRAPWLILLLACAGGPAWAQNGPCGYQYVNCQRGLVGASPPSLTDATMAPVSITTGGAVRIQPQVGGADVAAGNPLPVAPTSDVADAKQTDVNLALGTSNAAVTVTLGAGQSTVVFAVSGLTSSGATLTFEATDNAAAATPAWAAVTAVPPATGLGVTTTTTDGQWRVSAAGRQAVRVRVSTTGIGTAKVSTGASVGVGLVALSAPIPPGSNAIGTVTAKSPSAAFTVAGCTVGASSAQCLASATAVNHVTVQNTSAAANIACSWGGTAILNNSGSFMLVPGQSATWGLNTGGVPPSGALNCIASAASTPLYVEYN